MRKEGYNDNFTRSDIWVENELFNLCMRMRTLTSFLASYECRKELASELSDIESSLSHFRLDFVKSFEK